MNVAHTRIAHRHLALGWWSLLAFLTLGLGLETLHGFKVGFYLDVDADTRRLMWRLAHAHGTLLAVVHLTFAATLPRLAISARGAEFASSCLIGALVLMPMGFFLGGVIVHGGDPGIGVFLVPPGGILLFLGVLTAARGTMRPPHAPENPQ